MKVHRKRRHVNHKDLSYRKLMRESESKDSSLMLTGFVF